jgi:hypothetical protein
VRRPRHATDVTDWLVASVDLTEEFPFLVSAQMCILN